VQRSRTKYHQLAGAPERVPEGLVDGNVLLDIATIDPNWSDWSGMALAACAEHTTLIEALDGKPASPGGPL